MQRESSPTGGRAPAERHERKTESRTVPVAKVFGLFARPLRLPLLLGLFFFLVVPGGAAVFGSFVALSLYSYVE